MSSSLVPMLLWSDARTRCLNAPPRLGLVRYCDHLPAAASGRRCDPSEVHLERPLYNTCRRHQAGLGSRHPLAVSRLASRHVSSHPSRAHRLNSFRARIHASYVRPVSSTNGTFISGTRMQKNVEYLLREGDKITLTSVREGGGARTHNSIRTPHAHVHVTPSGCCTGSRNRSA
jgi:hypothetical protein